MRRTDSVKIDVSLDSPTRGRQERGRRHAARWGALVTLATGLVTACHGGTASGTPAADAVEQRLAACEQRLAELEEDDRVLFAEAAADLERGWNDAACARFETLLRRFPTSPLVAETRNRIERCRNGAGPVVAARGGPPAPEPSAAPPHGAPTGNEPDDTAGARQSSEPDPNEGAPLEISRTWLKEDRFGVPLANLRLTNRGDRTVVGYKVALRCYDDRGTALKHLTKGTTWFIAAGGSRQGGPGEAFAGGPWPLTGFLGAARIEAVVLGVDYADGTHWQRADMAEFSADKE